LLNRDNNIRYVALNTLSKVVNTDIQAVQRHRNTIVDCLKDPDVSIRRRALDLIYSLVNESNIRILVRELLNFLLISDVQFRPELVAKLCMVTEKYAPTKRWHVDTILRVMSIGGNFIPDDVPNNIVTLISTSPELHSYAVQKLYLALTQDTQHQTLVQVGVWCIGEFGDLLVAQDKPNDARGDEESISITVSEADTLDLLEQILRNPISSAITRQYTLTALLKLSSRFSHTSISRIRDIISHFKNSINVELQQRSCEYLQMFHWEQIRSQVLERMPPFEGRNIPESGSVAQVPIPSATAPVVPVQSASNDLLDLLLPSENTSQPRMPSAAPTNILNIFDDLSPTTSTPATTHAPAIAPSLNMNLLDLPLPTSPSTFAPSTGSMSTPSTTPAAQAPPASAASTNAVQVTGYSKNGILVVFEATKNIQQPQNTTLNAVYSNSNPFPINNFALQAAVPKYMKIQMTPASSNILPPSQSSKVNQIIKINNSMHGQKPVLLRIKLDFVVNGNSVSDTADVSFPPSV
jgi:AP-1 complex subunit gamma-1